MNKRFFKKEHAKTPYVLLNTKKCKACWKCQEICPNQVIGKINLPWHKHVLIADGASCSGCLKCVSICEFGAFSKTDKMKEKTSEKRKQLLNSFLINNLLLLFGLIMISSGLIMQLGFHLGGPHETQVYAGGIHSQSVQYEQLREIDTEKIVCGLTYPIWSVLHKIAIVVVSVLMVYHFYKHWIWYKVVISKRLIRKNIQVISLTVLFSLVAFTGVVPWFIDLASSSNILKLLLIEIHDKLALVLIIFLALHFIKRSKWYSKTFMKLKQ